LRGRADQLGRLEQAGDDRAGAGDRPGGAGAASRDALLRRLEQLPPGHPSSVPAGGSRDGSARASRDDSAGRESAAADRPPGGRDSGDGPARPGGPADARGEPVVSFLDRVGHFDSLWKAHLERWPEPAEGDAAAGAARPDDPPGSWRGAGDRYLAPGPNAEADRIIELLRKPEKAVTELLQKIQQDNPFGGYLVGLDHRLKGEDRLKEKIVEHLESEVGSTVTDAASEISDAVRYTSCFGPGEYVDGHGYVCQMLESSGCEMTYSKNYWIENSEYRGINSRWTTAEGDRFELQFHTSDSFYAKDVLTHPSYQRLRTPDTSRAELRGLHDYQREVSKAVPAPDRITEIADVRKEAS
jgi:hypothetical protein